jgi:hypothetical protein
VTSQKTAVYMDRCVGRLRFAQLHRVIGAGFLQVLCLLLPIPFPVTPHVLTTESAFPVTANCQLQPWKSVARRSIFLSRYRCVG